MTLPSPTYTRELLKAGIDRLGWQVGAYTYGNPNVIVHGRKTSGRLVIGKFCSIASRVSIFLGGEHRPDWTTTYPFTVFGHEWPTGRGITGHPTHKGDVVIGNDVWIGEGARIMSGVTIGHGAVIGNSALVTVDVPDYGIAIGNPARTLKKRFPEATIARLLELKWWDWDEQTIKRAIPLMCSVDIELFLNTFESGNHSVAETRIQELDGLPPSVPVQEPQPLSDKQLEAAVSFARKLLQGEIPVSTERAMEIAQGLVDAHRKLEAFRSAAVVRTSRAT
ncbi:CatB-related O-acetyltransferase [Reyranella sp.]|uniref:CatB-related O-acetyltransferase n=1 Tax=Reyranella sp. TaxID=1929291 RepID=UPI004036D034